MSKSSRTDQISSDCLPSYDGSKTSSHHLAKCSGLYSVPGHHPQQQHRQIVIHHVAEPLKPTSMDAYYIVFYVLVVAILSAFLNILTLFLTIPALMCAFMSVHKKSQGQPTAGTKLVSASYVLCVLNILLIVLNLVVIVHVEYTGADATPYFAFYYGHKVLLHSWIERSFLFDDLSYSYNYKLS